MDQPTINFMIGIASTLGISIIILAQQRKISRETYDASKREWSDVATLQKQRADALEEGQKMHTAQIHDLQQQIYNYKVIVSRLESEESRWSRRNSLLYELVQQYRAELARHGVSTPEPNGEE